MSGKKQHIVPQFLQKHFSNGDSIGAYMINKCYPTNIKDNMAENYFYSGKEDTTIDDIITKDEIDIVKILNKYQSEKVNESKKIEDDLIKMLLHFSTRTKYFLNFYTDSLINWLSDEIKKEEVKKEILDKLNKKSIILETELSNAFEEIKSVLSKNIKKKLREKIVKKNNHYNLKFLKDYNYIIKNFDNDIILPDTVVLFYIENKNYSPYPDKSNVVAIPITKNKLLICYENENIIENFNNEDINVLLSSISYEKFLTYPDVSLSNNYKLLMTNIKTQVVPKENLKTILLNDFQNGLVKLGLKKVNKKSSILFDSLLLRFNNK